MSSVAPKAHLSENAIRLSHVNFREGKQPICIPVESEAAPRISKEAVNRDPNVQRGLRDANSTYFRLEY
jgi:hypothetical protein